MDKGHQRLSLEKLKAWESLGYGMFIHFGMNTYDGGFHSMGDKPASYYNPDKLDVNQWVSVARDAGMKYAILTTKHDGGFCLWPTKHTDYHVGNSGNHADVVELFVKACAEKDIIPGFYYCSWDNHNLFGSKTPSMVLWNSAFTTRAYQDFQTAQIEELLTRYGKVGEVWIDIPNLLPRGYRQELYNRIAELQPDSLIVMNHGIGDGKDFDVNYAWPTDIITIEQCLPRVVDSQAHSERGHNPWRKIDSVFRDNTIKEKTYYLPGEVCDTTGYAWFFVEEDKPRSDHELLGMYLVARCRNTNFLLDVGPNKHGLIPQLHVDALLKLRKNIERNRL
jgi:alpha-L-fucosidase